MWSLAVVGNDTACGCEWVAHLEVLDVIFENGFVVLRGESAQLGADNVDDFTELQDLAAEFDGGGVVSVIRTSNGRSVGLDETVLRESRRRCDLAASVRPVRSSCAYSAYTTALLTDDVTCSGGQPTSCSASRALCVLGSSEEASLRSLAEVRCSYSALKRGFCPSTDGSSGGRGMSRAWIVRCEWPNRVADVFWHGYLAWPGQPLERDSRTGSPQAVSSEMLQAATQPTQPPTCLTPTAALVRRRTARTNDRSRRSSNGRLALCRHRPAGHVRPVKPRLLSPTLGRTASVVVAMARPDLLTTWKPWIEERETRVIRSVSFLPIVAQPTLNCLRPCRPVIETGSP